jgi:hypothetical protein
MVIGWWGAAGFSAFAAVLMVFAARMLHRLWVDTNPDEIERAIREDPPSTWKF